MTIVPADRTRTVEHDPPRPRAHVSWSTTEQLLDLTNDDARALLLERISGLVGDHGIDYIKWDHNRDLHEAVHSVAGADGRRLVDAPAVHAQTLAFYRLLDDLRARHPRLEIESCSSGGARVDLGVLEHTDRIWTSDCNDALERASIQRWTCLLVPSELMGTHIGPAVAHTTHRTVDLGFRMLMALQGHAGLEWDISTCSEAELEQLDGLDGARPRAATAAAHRRARSPRHA